MKSGFSFLEVLLALAILAVITASLMPLMTGLAAADRRVRLRAGAWMTAQAGLTARYLGDTAGWKEIGERPAFRIGLEPQPVAGGIGWNKLTVTPQDSTQAVLVVYLE